MSSRTLRLFLGTLSLSFLAACSAYSPFLSSSGPSADRVEDPKQESDLGIQLVDLTDAALRRVLEGQQQQGFAEAFGTAAAVPIAIGVGDTLEISAWEAPPAALFSTGTLERGMNSTSRAAVFPEQVVDSSGNITVPFIKGPVRVAGRTLQDVQQDIANRLSGQANRPQIFVKMLKNVSSTVTVVGEVTVSGRQPLSPYGERLLDILAASAGFRQPVGKITVQITRQVMEGGRRVPRVVSLPLDTVISDPTQNIVMQPGDVVTALYQPLSFTALGATTRNEEINFEGNGLSLAQALGRAGGLKDERANAMAIFIFRFEKPAVVAAAPSAPKTADGLVPVIYKLDMKQPAGFFIAQNFPVRNKDVIYVANAPAAELQKFLSLVTNIMLPAVWVRNLSY